MEDLAPVLSRIPGVVAVTLGGSRAEGRELPDSDWDFGLYYRGRIEADDVRALGFEGNVVEPGESGRLVNGGAWLVVDSQRVDLLYRDIDFVEYWVSEANEGRYEVDRVYGCVAGMPTYALAAELAVGRVLHGQLPRPFFSAALAQTAPPRWMDMATFSLNVAQSFAKRNDRVGFFGLLAQATIATAHVRLAAWREWVLNEKGIADRAGLSEAHDALLQAGSSDLLDATVRLRRILGLNS